MYDVATAMKNAGLSVCIGDTVNSIQGLGEC